MYIATQVLRMLGEGFTYHAILCSRGVMVDCVPCNMVASLLMTTAEIYWKMYNMQGCQDCMTVSATFKLLESFEGILERPLIARELHANHLRLLTAYSTDLGAVSSFLLPFRQSSPSSKPHYAYPLICQIPHSTIPILTNYLHQTEWYGSCYGKGKGDFKLTC